MGWDPKITFRAVRETDFDNRIFLIGDVGDHLAVAGRVCWHLSYIVSGWLWLPGSIAMVEDTRLEEFMFGAERSH